MSFIRRFHPEATKIDAIGIGRGAVDYIKMNERALAGKIVGVHVGSAAQKSDAFANLRAEGFWHLRELFQDGEIAIDPKDEELSAQLKDLRYEPTSGGRIIIESKESMKRRGLRSPDRADAVMLACIPTRRRSGVTWGRKPGQHAVAPAYGRYGR
jgi:phage terminase large subunit